MDLVDRGSTWSLWVPRDRVEGQGGGEAVCAAPAHPRQLCYFCLASERLRGPWTEESLMEIPSGLLPVSRYGKQG